MKKRIFLSLCLAFVFITAIAFTASAESTYSEFWYQSADGNWHVKDEKGNLIKNCWFCDDAVPSNGRNIWYLIDAKGDMISGGLVKDTSGNYYSLETRHEGRYGMLRYVSGTYDGVSLTLNPEHNGSFAGIMNPDGITGLAALYGEKNISIGSGVGDCVYSSDFLTRKNAAGPASTSSGPGSNSVVYDGKTVTYNGKTYQVDFNWGYHYLTGYSATTRTASGTYGTPHHTLSGPKAMLGKTVYIRRVSGPLGSEYDGIYVFEDTGGAAVETGTSNTMNTPVADIFVSTIEEAVSITARGWTTVEMIILK